MKSRMIYPPRPSPRQGLRAGFTVIEMTISMAVLLIGLGATLGSISSFTVLGDSTRETTLAYLAAQETLEEMQAADFRTMFVLYNEDAGDDPAGVVPGPNFDVPELSPQEGDADGRVGRILFPTPPGEPEALRENANLPDFGLPRDLNADGVPDGDDRSGDYVLMPVRIRVEWRGRTGNRFIELQTLLTNR